MSVKSCTSRPSSNASSWSKHPRCVPAEHSLFRLCDELAVITQIIVRRCNDLSSRHILRLISPISYLLLYCFDCPLSR